MAATLQQHRHHDLTTDIFEIVRRPISRPVVTAPRWEHQMRMGIHARMH